MKIRSVEILNFRGLKNIHLSDLKEMVVIAGPNGCGKSCVLDAIRLVKSFYGGYQQNEVHQWLGEFQINFTHDRHALDSLMQDPKKRFLISIFFELQEDEKKYLKENAEEIAREASWKSIAPELYSWSAINNAPLAVQMRSREEEVEHQTRLLLDQFLLELENDVLHAQLSIEPEEPGRLKNLPSSVLRMVFSLYEPNKIGVIEFNGAKRHYERENIQGININLDAMQHQQRSHVALYNYTAKYANVKTELASSYVKEALAQRAGFTPKEDTSLTKTLQELFKTFFPDKEFLGPIATNDGFLKFPVRTASGAEHDLNELSSGEKEILFGYLRLRNNVPRNSIILLDEPELHLNPRLLQGLPDFYHRNLGIVNNNQIWLVTHSDALLREAVGAPGFSVFHISAPTGDEQNQAKEISVDADMESAIVDLVGDLASYRPGAKVVILEGEDSEFDKRMISMLFPEFSGKVNAISGGNKSGVERLRASMTKAVQAGRIPMKIYSITDADLDTTPKNQDQASLRWDVYHIENYLLDENIIKEVLEDLRLGTKTLSITEISQGLRQAAEDCIPSLVRHVLQNDVNNKTLSLLSIKVDPKRKDIAECLYDAMESSKKRIETLFLTEFSIEQLKKNEAEINDKFRSSLKDGTWISQHRGRDILKRFAGKYAPEVDYKVFRNLIISKMVSKRYKPEGMKKIIDKII